MASTVQQNCPLCIDGIILTDATRGEEICSKCGFVLSQRAEELGPESYSYSDRDDLSRCGIPASLAIHDMGLATIIGQTGRDATGKPLSGAMKSMIERLRIWDTRSQVCRPTDRNFRKAFSELDRLKDKIVLPDTVIEKAAYIYRKAVGKRLVIGRSIHVMIAASLYAACRYSDTPRTLDEIAVANNVKRKELARSYRLLLNKFDLKMPLPDPIKCVVKIARTVGLNEKTARKALQILNEASTREISAGKDPMGFAAAALYLSCVINNERNTQSKIAKAANVSEVTIRNRYKELTASLKYH
ncbi:MAG: transcription initiation factor IIB [Thaumarchaeota archaeon]|nr:transcription initiation factor IIB [Nitrososphaerota archaeon]